MKKATLISIGLIVLGFVFEFLYLYTEMTFFKMKFAMLGLICWFVGMIGLVLYTILPAQDKSGAVSD